MIYTYMADAAALTTGAPVNLDGIPDRQGEDHPLSGSKDPMRLVRIDMQIPEHTLKDIPSDSLASISAANVLGTKYINIKSGKSTTPMSTPARNFRASTPANSGSGAAGLWRDDLAAGYRPARRQNRGPGGKRERAASANCWWMRRSTTTCCRSWLK
jgi:hypothetical protein